MRGPLMLPDADARHGRGVRPRAPAGRGEAAAGARRSARARRCDFHRRTLIAPAARAGGGAAGAHRAGASRRIARGSACRCGCRGSPQGARRSRRAHARVPAARVPHGPGGHHRLRHSRRVAPPTWLAAFRALGRADAVFGPAADGGYWLVGLVAAPPGAAVRRRALVHPARAGRHAGQFRRPPRGAVAYAARRGHRRGLAPACAARRAQRPISLELAS